MLRHQLEKMSRLKLMFHMFLIIISLMTVHTVAASSDIVFVLRFLQKTSSSLWRMSNSSACNLVSNATAPPPPTSNFEVQCSSSSITVLILEHMNLHGPFPSQTLGNLSRLTHLSLAGNALTGPLPAELFTNLPNLAYLSLSNNLFSGSIPPYPALPKLTRLDLSYNRISGALPSDFSQLPNLRYLYLADNNLTASLPPSLLSLPNLLDVNVSGNFLDGSLVLPDYLPALWNLDLSRNSLSGFLPSFGEQQAVFLKRLDLSHNLLIGDVSVSLSSMPRNLTWLDLSNNKLTGKFNLMQPWKAPLLSLSYLSIAANALQSSSCGWIASYLNLAYLNLSKTHITGAIPDNISSLISLSVLDLSYNEIDGVLPASMLTLKNLTYLDLSHNNISGNASVLANLPRLSYLNLSFNDPADCVSDNLQHRFGSDSFIGLCEPFAASLSSNGGSGLGFRSSKHFVLILGCVTLAVFMALCCVLIASFSLNSRRRIRRGKDFSGFVAKKPPVEEKYVSGPFSFETESGMWLVNVKDANSIPVVMFEKPLLKLNFADLLQATSSFCKESQLTEGGFGPVYRASLPGGLDVTIKVLIEGRILNDQEAADEFGALSKIKHVNLVPFLGYCLVGDERLVIYQYMENGGLHRWLHDLPIGTQLDDWSRDLQWEPVQSNLPASGELGYWHRRHKIGLGIARALSFLHHGHSPQIVHRDVKSSNVLLDENYEPHLANTGLVGLLAATDEGLFAGSTSGYVPPEYKQPGSKVSIKGDVYSYGVVLLELVTGKRPFGDFYQEGFNGNLVGWVRYLMKEKRTHRALDPRISSDKAAISEMLEALRIGYLCTADASSKRPTMQQVVGLLKDLDPNGKSPR